MRTSAWLAAFLVAGGCGGSFLDTDDDALPDEGDVSMDDGGVVPDGSDVPADALPDQPVDVAPDVPPADDGGDIACDPGACNSLCVGLGYAAGGNCVGADCICRSDGDADVTPDVTPDVVPDVEPDVAPDVEPDVAPDVEPDVEPDVPADVPADVPVDVPADTPCTLQQIAFEAEDMTITGNFEVRTSSRPSIGQYLRATSATGGEASISLDIPCAADWRLWGLVWGGDSTRDSFYWSWDGDAVWPVWDFLQCAGARDDWYWDLVSGRPAGDTCGTPPVTDPAIFTLSAGTHVFTIRTRESAALVAEFILTNDPAFTP